MIILQSKPIAYTLRQSSRARHLRLTVYGDGSVIATMPRGFGKSKVEDFIRKKSRWLFNKINYFRRFKSAAPARRLGRRDYLKHKSQALALVKERAVFYNRHYCNKIGKINIKNQKTRWGSCSKKGNLNFNFKLLFLPEELQDYIIVHELCHLQELNHSKNFWGLVAQTFPQWRQLKKELKTSTVNL